MNTGFVENKGIVEQQTHAWLPINHKTILNPFSRTEFHSKKKASYPNPNFTNKYNISISEYSEANVIADIKSDKPSLVDVQKDPRPQTTSVQLKNSNAEQTSTDQLVANNPQANGMMAGVV